MRRLTSDGLAETYRHASARHAAALADTLERVTQRAELAEGDHHNYVAVLSARLKLEADVDWLTRRNHFLEDKANALDADNRRLRRARIHDGALIREALAKLIADGKVEPQPFEEGAADMLREDQEPWEAE